MAGVEIRMARRLAAQAGDLPLRGTSGARASPAARMAGGLGPVRQGRVRPRLAARCSGSLRKKLGLRRVRRRSRARRRSRRRCSSTSGRSACPVREGYGQTENTALATLTPTDDVRIGTVGPAATRASRSRIAADGEILTRGAGRLPRLLQRPGGHRGHASTPTAGCTPATSASSTTTASSRSPTARRTSSSPPAARTSRRRRSRTSSRSRPTSREAIVIGDRRKYLVALIGIERDTVGDWAAQRSARRSPPTSDLSRQARGASSSIAQRGRARSTPTWPRSRRSSASRCCPRSSTRRTASSPPPRR